MDHRNYISDDIKDIYERNDLIKEAERLYTKEINADKNNAENYIRRAYFYMRNGKNEKAISDCKTAIKISPKNKTILTLAEMLINEAKSRMRKSGKYFKEIL